MINEEKKAVLENPLQRKEAWAIRLFRLHVEKLYRQKIENYWIELSENDIVVHFIRQAECDITETVIFDRKTLKWRLD